MSFNEALKQKELIHAINEEIRAIQKNETWELITLLKEKNAIGVKWVLKIKKNANGDCRHLHLSSLGVADDYSYA
ncbi:Retrovirus-related Pol polyprotein from transposon TNT 1-94 [Bienertia sinuspersici]